MVRLIAKTKLEFDLVREALTNHGFKFTCQTRRMFFWFGPEVYKVFIEFVPNVQFLQQLLHEAEKIEDYYLASSIQRMIDIKQGK
jgi:hypothetical protein